MTSIKREFIEKQLRYEGDVVIITTWGGTEYPLPSNIPDIQRLAELILFGDIDDEEYRRKKVKSGE